MLPTLMLFPSDVNWMFKLNSRQTLMIGDSYESLMMMMAVKIMYNHVQDMLRNI